MRHSIQFAWLCAALLLAACGRQSPMDERLKQDLKAASVATMEMAPSGRGTKVVSAIEQTGKTQPLVTRARQAPAPARTPKPETPQETKTSISSEPTATRPTSAPPKVQACPRGGCKTVDEVIRNAPFPIKPATKRP